ncbi:MAG: hypothetical protein DRP08_07305 [Candidatus Aenigmatarchaeota archaeon]|nr:MAG: hypothetical protein DRP08_07305 [Candidatus Aenigmarchaeota archaeon]
MSETNIKFEIYVKFDDEGQRVPPHPLTELGYLGDIIELIQVFGRFGIFQYLKEFTIRPVEVENSP